MESRRRNEKNKVYFRIKQLKKYNEIDHNTITRFKRANVSKYILNQLPKLKDAIQRREGEISDLNKRILDIGNGLVDEELNTQYIQEQQVIKQKENETLRKKKENKERKNEQKKTSNAYWQETIKASRKVRANKRGMQRSYKHFVKACNSIPTYMRKNLSKMPNNKGYIWKSVVCYGELPAQRGKPTILFEKCRGGILKIHEHTETEERIYEKQGKTRKKLIYSKYKRKKKLGGTSLIDYISLQN